jgi:hypothetical protein
MCDVAESNDTESTIIKGYDGAKSPSRRHKEIVGLRHFEPGTIVHVDGEGLKRLALRNASEFIRGHRNLP